MWTWLEAECMMGRKWTFNVMLNVKHERKKAGMTSKRQDRKGGKEEKKKEEKRRKVEKKKGMKKWGNKWRSKGEKEAGRKNQKTRRDIKKEAGKREIKDSLFLKPRLGTLWMGEPWRSMKVNSWSRNSCSSGWGSQLPSQPASTLPITFSWGRTCQASQQEHANPNEPVKWANRNIQ